MHWQTNFCAHTNSNLYDNNACIDNILNIPLIRTITYQQMCKLEVEFEATYHIYRNCLANLQFSNNYETIGTFRF